MRALTLARVWLFVALLALCTCARTRGGGGQAYYRNNRAHGAVREEWDHKGLYVNWWEVEPLVLQMPWGLKTMWHNRMMPLVEEWAGGEALERTDIYGIRIYQRGARLLSHVDRCAPQLPLPCPSLALP